jgi:hypothetical protein
MKTTLYGNLVNKKGLAKNLTLCRQNDPVTVFSLSGRVFMNVQA